MKKLMAIAAAALSFTMAFGFAACGGTTTTKPLDKNYNNYDISDSTQQETVEQNVVDHIDVDKLFGDTSNGLSYGATGTTAITVEFKNLSLVPAVPEGQTAPEAATVNGSIKLEANETAYAETVEGATASKVTAKAGLKKSGEITLNESAATLIKGMTGMADAQYTLLESVLKGEYSFDAYIDENMTAYVSVPESLASGLGLPESGKIKVPMATSNPSSPYAMAAAEVESPEKQQISEVVGTVLEYCAKYKVAVALHDSEDGFGVKLTANKDTLMAVLNDTSLGIPEQVLTYLKSEKITYNACLVEVGVMLDAEGALSAAQLKLELDVSANGLEIPNVGTVTGGVAVKLDLSLGNTAEKVTAPADLDKYTDLTTVA